MGMIEVSASVGLGLFTGVLATELGAWAPTISTMLARFAAKLAGQSLESRLREEWEGHLSELPGPFSKLLAAVGFCVAGAGFGATVQLARAAIRVRSVGEWWGTPIPPATLSLGQRLGFMAAVLFGSSLAFGALLAGLHALAGLPD